jgi:hypothetical protein
MGKLEKRPASSPILVRWIRAVLTSHTAFLMSVPDLAERFAGLYQTIDARVGAYKKLLRLYGRVELLLANSPAELKASSSEVSSVALQHVVEEGMYCYKSCL